MLTLDETLAYFQKREKIILWLKLYNFGPDSEPSCYKCGSERLVDGPIRFQLRCRECNAQRSLLSGIFAARSHVAPKFWLAAMWLFAHPEHMITAKAFSLKTGIRHQTTAFMFARLKSWKRPALQLK